MQYINKINITRFTIPSIIILTIIFQNRYPDFTQF